MIVSPIILKIALAIIFLLIGFFVIILTIGNLSRYLNYLTFKIVKPIVRKSKHIKPLSFNKNGLTGHIAINQSLSASLINSSKESSNMPILIFFGGSFDISYNAVYDYGDLWKRVIFIAPDYYGTQKSKGKMNLMTMKKTATDFYDQLIKIKEAENRPIYVMGYSFGTGMATYLASKRPVDKLILVAGYRDSADLYNIFTPLFFGWIKCYIKDNIRSSYYADKVKCPTYIIGSTGDNQLGVKIQQELFKVFSKGQLKIFKDIKHQDYFINGDVIKYIQELIDNK